MKKCLFLLSAGTLFVSTVSAANYSCDEKENTKSRGERYQDSEGYYTPRERLNRQEESDEDSDERDVGYPDTRNDNRDQQTDRELMNRIKAALESNGPVNKYRLVDIQVNHGVVILRGAVETEEDRQEIKKKIKNLENLKRIEDRLETRAKEQNQNPRVIDAQVKQKIQDAIKADGYFSKGYENVNFDVIDGSVTLRGTVDSESNKKDIMEKVAKIDGIRKIDNQIRVQPRK